jgi:hypothetical protein
MNIFDNNRCNFTFVIHILTTVSDTDDS